MKHLKDLIVETEPGIYSVVNYNEQKLFIYYRDKSYLKKLGAIMENLVKKSNLNHLDLACFSIFIEEKNNFLTELSNKIK